MLSLAIDMGGAFPKEKLIRWGTVLAGTAVLVGAAVFFALALVPRLQDKPADYLTYSFEGLDRVPDDLILYRESASVPVPPGDGDPAGLCLLPDGGGAVSSGATVFLFSSDHVITSGFSTGQPVLALAAGKGPDGTRLFCATIDHIVVYTTAGRLVDEWASLGEQAHFTSVAVSAAAVFAADAGNKSVAVFDRNGRLVHLLTIHASGVDGFLVPGLCFDVAVDKNNRLWAVDPGRYRVVELSDKGEILSSWGEAGPTLAGFSGCCNPANIALLPDGRFVAQEKGLLRIKIYDRSGRLLGFVAGPETFHPTLTKLDTAAAPNGDVYVLDPHERRVRVFSPREGGR